MPMTLPACRAALMTPAASPPWWPGAASVVAAVTDGVIIPMPMPVAAIGRISQT
jgi:hypothetical protein